MSGNDTKAATFVTKTILSPSLPPSLGMGDSYTPVLNMIGD